MGIGHVRSSFLTELVTELDVRVLSANTDQPATANHCRDLRGLNKTILESRKNSKLVPHSTPACRHLSDCYSNLGVAGDAKLVNLIRTVDREIAWTEGYRAQTDDETFLDNFAFGEIVGRAGIFYNEIVTIGLTLLGPQLYYKWHYHPAIELYYTLNGPSSWAINGGSLIEKPAGSLILHPTMVIHATQSHEHPLLALWYWTGDTATPSTLIQ